jgi:hypothetical protein
MGTVSDDAVKHAAQVHGCSERSVRDHLSLAKQYQDGVWWIDTCKQAHIWEAVGNAAGTSTAAAVGASVAAAVGKAAGTSTAAAVGASVAAAVGKATK